MEGTIIHAGFACCSRREKTGILVLCKSNLQTVHGRVYRIKMEITALGISLCWWVTVLWLKSCFHRNETAENKVIKLQVLLLCVVCLRLQGLFETYLLKLLAKKKNTAIVIYWHRHVFTLKMPEDSRNPSNFKYTS